MNAKIMAAALLCCTAGIAQAETQATDTTAEPIKGYRCAVHDEDGNVLRGGPDGYFYVGAKTEDEADVLAKAEAEKLYGAGKVDSVSCGPKPR